MKEPMYPVGIEPLPLAGASGEGEGLKVQFVRLQHGAVAARLYDEYLNVVDEIRAHSFMETYEAVAREYPMASWSPKE